MRRGTTPTIQLTIDGLSDIQIKELYLTLKQESTQMDKMLADVQIENNVISTELTQEETLALKADKKVALQVRILANDNTAFATNILSVPVEQILKDGVI